MSITPVRLTGSTKCLVVCRAGGGKLESNSTAEPDKMHIHFYVHITHILPHSYKLPVRPTAILETDVLWLPIKNYGTAFHFPVELMHTDIGYETVEKAAKDSKDLFVRSADSRTWVIRWD